MEMHNFASVTQVNRNPLTTSDKYRPIPTSAAVSVLADAGWVPSSFQEARAKKAENKGFQQHLVRFRNEEFSKKYADGRAYPEIVLRNSHSGDASFRIFAGLVEMVCLNGLIVGSQFTPTERVVHLGPVEKAVGRALASTVRHLPRVLETRDRWVRTDLSGVAETFARKAAELRFDPSESEVDPRHLIDSPRPQQADGSLWSVFNTVQERLIRGGVLVGRRDGTVGKCRPIKGIDDTLRINRGLWDLAEEFEGMTH